ncbi:MAG: HD domain-containing protein [Desulfurococcaceae archaeon]
MVSIIQRLLSAVSSDLNRIRETIEEGGLTTLYPTIYYNVLSCNPKPYPISGFQHFFGTAFLAIRLAEFFELDEREQVIAFLAGLLHDYEKMGLNQDILIKDMSYIIGENTSLYAELSEYEDSWNDAVEVALKLESGGLPRELQKIAEFVRLGDYLTGGEESWNISYVMDLVKGTLNSMNVSYHLIPVIVGKQRPVTAIVAEKLNDLLIEAGLTPLVSTPTGSLYLSKKPLVDSEIRMVYDKLADHISSEIVRASTIITISKSKVVNLNPIKNLINYSNKKPNIGRVISVLPNLRQLSISDIDETFNFYVTSADKFYKVLLIIWSVLIYAKTLGSVKNNLPDALRELGLVNIRGMSIQEVVLNLYNYLNNFNPQDLNNLLVNIKDKLIKIKKMLSTSVNVDDVRKVIERTINVGYKYKMEEETMASKESVCSICRERVSKPKVLREYLDRFKKILDVNVSELFHPDKQGKPEDYGSLERFSSSVPICSVCEYESIVFPATTSFFDGMWASNIVYYPAMSIDLLQVVKNVVGNYVVVALREARRGGKREEIKPLVIPDYISSRIIVRTSDERGRLSKKDLEMALDIWFLIGGNLILTTNALSVPPPWSGLPIEMEISDIVIEESVNKFVEELRIAKEKNEWSRTRKLRKVLYEQLKTYIRNLEESEKMMGRTRFVKSGLVTSNAPALDIYSFTLRKHM